MKSIDRNFLKQLAHQFDLMNTINGGVSMTHIEVTDFDDKSEIDIFAAGVDPESFNIYINNNELMIFSVLPAQKNETTSPIAVPMFSRTFTIPPFVDDENIEAVQEGDKLKIILPFKDNSKEGMRRIDIKHTF